MSARLRLVHDRDATENGDGAAPGPRRSPTSPSHAYWLARMRLAAAERRLAEQPDHESAQLALQCRLAFAQASRALIRSMRH